MEKAEDTLSTKTTSDFIAQMMMDEKDGEEFTREYLKTKFLSSAVRALYLARRNAGLTQAQVAERLNTKQAAIARLEADTDGSMSLRRFAEFALACGMDPLDITLEPVESVRDYVIHNPQAPRTQVLYNTWLVTNRRSVQMPGGNVVPVEGQIETISQTRQTQNERIFTAEMSTGGTAMSGFNAVPSITSLQNIISSQEYFQPPLLSPLQVLPSRSTNSTDSEPQNQTLTLAQPQANHPPKVAA
jgi:transcriptional regulator with XRE-family HTH domain